MNRTIVLLEHAHIGLGSFDEQVRALRLQLRGGVTTIGDPAGDPLRRTRYYF